MGLDTDSICAALLHDTVEDCSDKTNLEEVRKKFGDEVAMLVDGLTKIVQVVASAQDLHLDDCPVLPLEAGYIRIRFHSLAGDQAVLRTLAQRT